jgi:hypothetical protein
MHLPKRHLTKHHRARLVAWTLAMLAWMAEVLFAAAPFIARHERQRGASMSLDRLTWRVKTLILLHAADLAPRRAPKRFIFRRHGRNLLRPGLLRATFGSHLRRALKRKHIAERIAILVDALRRIDVWAAGLAKRMRRGLTKCWPLLPAPTPAAPVRTLAVTEACLADTS